MKSNVECQRNDGHLSHLARCKKWKADWKQTCFVTGKTDKENILFNLFNDFLRVEQKIV